MADFLLTQLGLLPENVKRDIAARLGDAGGGCAPIHHQDAARADAAPASTVQQQNANGADLTAAIAGRQLRLPAMQGGACVADGALSRTEVQVRGRLGAACSQLERWTPLAAAVVCGAFVRHPLAPDA
jgi:hypothetical protein